MFKKNGLTLAAGASAVLLLIIIGVTAVVGLTILRQTALSNTNAFVNATAGNASLGIQQITSQLTLVGLIVVMAIVIGLLWSSFGGMMGRGEGL